MFATLINLPFKRWIKSIFFKNLFFQLILTLQKSIQDLGIV
jgi:hypothetical protein